MGKTVDKPILITGSSGFLAAHLKKELEERGDIPYDTLDIFGSPTWRFNIMHPLPFSLSGFSRVIHLAGVLGTHELFDEIDRAIDVNIKGTVNILKLCAREGIPFTGVTMAHVWKNPYETTKLAAERLAEAWGREFDFPVDYLTVYNAYGEHQAHGRGHPQKIIPTFATAAHQDKPMPIWGDGSQVVDLVYAGDVARLLLHNPQNLEGGHGLPLTVNHVADLVWSMVRDSEPKKAYLPMRRGEHPPARDPVAERPVRAMESVLMTLERTVRWYA